MTEDASAPTGALVGYIRVSSAQQTYDGQHDKLTTFGCKRIFHDVMGGQRADRPGYLALLAYVRPGDVVMVTSLDRFGRSLSGIVRAIEQLGESGIYIRTLRESIDTSTSVGRMLAGIFGSLAQYERELIAERAAMARKAAMDRGQLPGRPRKLDEAAVRQLAALRASGEHMPALAARFGVSQATAYRALAGIASPQ